MDKASLQTQDCQKKWHVQLKYSILEQIKIAFRLPYCPRKISMFINP